MAKHARGVSWGIMRCEKWGKNSASLHSEGRALDWHLDVHNAKDRKEATRLIDLWLAPDKNGNIHALARRMGIMYLIWDDHFYPAYHQFEQESYLSSSCRSKRKCAKTLRHRDHMHISLSKAGGKGLTSFYVDLVPSAG